MAKTASQRQAEYIQRKKSNDAEFNKICSLQSATLVNKLNLCK